MSYLIKIHLCLGLSSALPLRFSDQDIVRISHFTLRATCPAANLILLDLINLLTFKEHKL